MKRSLSLFLIPALVLSLLSGCNGASSNSSSVSVSQTGSSSSEISSSSTVVRGGSSSQAGSSAIQTTASAGASTVYMTTDISPKGLMAVYNALGRKATGKTAVKISTGEPGDTYYLNPNLIKGLVQHINGTFVECNTIYGGKRANTAMNLQAAKDHGFTSIAKVDIMDADGAASLPVKGGSHLKEDLVGAHLKNYDFLVVLSHFKGHLIAGFGGAIKNMSIGIGSGNTSSGSGKSLIHSGGALTSGFNMNANQNNFLESMAEATKAVADYEGNHILYINVMNNLSVDCDCDSNPAKPTMKDIGILASLDPVALDKACVDLVNAAPDGHDLQERIKSRNGVHALEWGQKIGLGSETYKLVKVNG